jgi:hypothetical protein
MSKVVMGVVSRILELGIFLAAAVGLGALVLAIR